MNKPMIFGAIFLSGCATTTVRQPSAYQQFVQQVNELHNQALIKEGAPQVTDEVKSPTYQAEFEEKVCKLPKDTSKRTKAQAEKCTADFMAAFFARIQERYYMADVAAVNSHCQAHPVECHDPTYFEQKVRDSHNTGVEASRQAKLTSAAYQQQEYENREAIYRAAMLQRATQTAPVVQNPFGSPPVNCTSSANVFGGWNTQCR